MVIAAGGCDNVEWGGFDVAVVPPPPKTAPIGAEPEPGESLPEGPVLYHVVRDTLGPPTMVPVGFVSEGGLQPIVTGDDPADFGQRFITSLLRAAAEFTLFHNGRRAGTFILEDAEVPAGPACRPLPRATGRLELSSAAAEATEFLAMARTQAPEGRMLADDLEPERRMQVVGPILAERVLRSRNVPLPNWSRALRQIQPFPVSGSQDPGFTATFLSDDALEVGHDDQGYSLFVVYTPLGQAGYDTAYVDFTSYTASGKAAPRTIDFLDWNRDGAVELLLEVFGTRNRWYEAVGLQDGEWTSTFVDRCDPRPEPAPQASPDTAAVPPTGPPDATPGAEDDDTTGSPGAGTPTATTRRDTPGPGVGLDVLEIEPIIQLSPMAPLPTRPDTQPDSSPSV